MGQEVAAVSSAITSHVASHCINDRSVSFNRFNKNGVCRWWPQNSWNRGTCTEWGASKYAIHMHINWFGPVWFGLEQISEVTGSARFSCSAQSLIQTTAGLQQNAVCPVYNWLQYEGKVLQNLDCSKNASSSPQTCMNFLCLFHFGSEKFNQQKTTWINVPMYMLTHTLYNYYMNSY